MAKNDSRKRDPKGKNLTNGPSPAVEDIARLAYEKFEQRGCGNGSDLDDWLTAEGELIHRGARSKK